MGEVGCLKDGHFQNLHVEGSLTGNKIHIKNVTVAATQLTEEDSGCICIFHLATAVAITLPLITATNIGMNYEFFIRTESAGTSASILTASTSDTTGDCFLGALQIGINAAWGAAAAQDGGIFYLPSGDASGDPVAGFHSVAANINQINMTGTQADGGGEVGSYVRCVATEFSAGGHSLWQVTGLVGTDDPNGTGIGTGVNGIFIDRD